LRRIAVLAGRAASPNVRRREKISRDAPFKCHRHTGEMMIPPAYPLACLLMGWSGRAPAPAGESNWAGAPKSRSTQKLNSAIAVIGIDIGKNSFHLAGHDKRGAIVLRQKWSRSQVEARLANVPPCLIGMEACVGAREQRRRNVETERFGCLQVDYEFVFGRRLHRQVGRLLALEDAVDVSLSHQIKRG
jgi:hypothetical protein